MYGNSKSAEIELNFCRILNHIREAVMIIQSEKIIYANRAAIQLVTGCESSPVEGMLLSQFLNPKDLSLLQRQIDSFDGSDTDKQPIRLSIHATDGIVRPAEACIHPSPDCSNADLFQLTLQDISDRKAIELNLMQSEKLAVLGKLSAGILHEIRNPLTSIKGFLQLIQQEPVVNKTYLDVILNEINQMEKIANGLLYLTKPQTELCTKIDLVAAIQEVLFLFEASTTKNHITIDICSDGADHLISGDMTQMKQLFINLIKNACEAINHEGHISVIFSSEGPYEKVEIRDTGKGMPEAVINRLGKSFFTTKQSGTGLGLMVSYNIIKNHKGRISVNSKENKGTTFTLIFPAYVED